MEQVEIVRRTREMFELSGKMPRVQDVDPSARPVKLDILELANRLLEVERWEDLAEEERAVRGFFTQRARPKFAITMVTECVSTEFRQST
jgi:hypothetical protein